MLDVITASWDNGGMTELTQNVLGQRIRKLRGQANLTLAEFSRLSGVALATISRIETGKMTGTLESHMGMAKALGIPLPELYRDMQAETPLVVVRRGGGPAGDKFFYGKGAAYEMLTSKIFAKRMMPMLLVLAPGKATQAEESQPSVEKFLYVLKGTVEAHVGTEKHLLKAGDTLYCAASLSHHWRNPGKTEAQCICVISPPSL